MERIFRVVRLEGIATAILAPTTAWLMQHLILEIGGLTALFVTAVVIWNIIYDALFDRLWPSHLVKRTTKVRAFHASDFESSFIMIGVSIVMYVLNVNLAQTFMLGIGFLLLFPPCTMFYNWAYNTLHERVTRRHQQRVTT